MSFSVVSETNDSSSLTLYANQEIHRLFDQISNFTHFKLEPTAFNACIGCFSCWLKTPGTCCFKDLTTEFNRCFILNDFIVLVTPIYYGCYSSGIKKILDRSIPNVLPFFKTIKGEVHHMQRYKQKAQLLILAYNEHLTDEEKATFLSLTKANSINLAINEPEVYFCQTPEQIRHALIKIHDKVNMEVDSHA